MNPRLSTYALRTVCLPKRIEWEGQTLYEEPLTNKYEALHPGEPTRQTPVKVDAWQMRGFKLVSDAASIYRHYMSREKGNKPSDNFASMGEAQRRLRMALSINEDSSCAWTALRVDGKLCKAVASVAYLILIHLCRQLPVSEQQAVRIMGTGGEFPHVWCQVGDVVADFWSWWLPSPHLAAHGRFAGRGDVQELACWQPGDPLPGDWANLTRRLVNLPAMNEAGLSSSAYLADWDDADGLASCARSSFSARPIDEQECNDDIDMREAGLRPLYVCDETQEAFDPDLVPSALVEEFVESERRRAQADFPRQAKVQAIATASFEEWVPMLLRVCQAAMPAEVEIALAEASSEVKRHPDLKNTLSMVLGWTAGQLDELEPSHIEALSALLREGADPFVEIDGGDDSPSPSVFSRACEAARVDLVKLFLRESLGERPTALLKREMELATRSQLRDIEQCIRDALLQIGSPKM